MKYFIANWKANKNLSGALVYLDIFLAKIDKDKSIVQKLQDDEMKIILAPPFLFLPTLKEKIQTRKNIHLASQDISPFEDGAYTGEITGRMLFGLVDFAIVAHSERRKYYPEKDEILFRRASLALKYNLTPIYGLRDQNDAFPQSVKIVAYEPENAIGTGNNEPVENVVAVKQKLNLTEDVSYIYGGSVNRNNASGYMKSGEISGFLVGTASLDPQHFFDIIQTSL